MKKILLILFGIVLISSFALSQVRARINVEHVTHHSLTTLGLTTNSVSAGLRVIPNGTFAYMSAQNMASLTIPVTNAVFELVSKPSGSTTTLQTLTSPSWTMFKPDLKGEYQVKVTITTASGTDDTTQSFYAADWVGVGNFEGIAGSFPKCMTCHSSMPAFQTIFDKWKVSGHGTTFKDFAMVDPTGGHFGPSCFKCHTTGTDKNLAFNNAGFDDVASTLGWSWTPSNPLKWDTIKTQFSGLVNLATVGCEMCHGAGSQHALAPSKQNIQVGIEDGTCASCHDEEPYYPEYQQYENSLHSEAIWETGFATRGIPNPAGLSDCMRCHAGKGFVLFTKGLASTSPVSPTWAEHTSITCATCHDPHGNTNHASLREGPAASDTLGNGYNYSAMGGHGQLCMNCHKARRNNVTYVSTNVSSTWGPHYNAETDVFLGRNAYDLPGAPYATTTHSAAVTNSCVECHMAPTDTSAANKNKVGGHSFKFTNSANGFELTKACESCHGPKANFDAFVAFMDYDGDGSIESVRNEIKGLLTLLAKEIPPYGVDSISWTGIRSDPDSVKLKKAWWNYQLIQKGSAYGMHNAKYAIDVLTKSVIYLGGVIPVELLDFTAEMNKGQVTLNWETATETNNRGFEIQRKVNNNWQTIGFVSGNGTTTQMSYYSYTDNPVGVINYAKLTYRLKQMDYDGKANYSKEINVEFTGAPKTFSLAQNYPNPFNPATNIRYSIPTESQVKVVVYNLAGEIVSVLVNEVMAAGYHEATFNSKVGFASGIYLYSIEAAPTNGNAVFRQTKKMLLVK